MIGNSTNEKHVCISRAWMDYPSWLIKPLTHRWGERFSNTVLKIQAGVLPPEFHPALGTDLLFASSISLFSSWVAKQQVVRHHWRHGAVAQSSLTERACSSSHQKHQTKGCFLVFSAVWLWQSDLKLLIGSALSRVWVNLHILEYI